MSIENPLIEGYLMSASQTPQERESQEMFISPEAEWLEYIEKGLIGFGYTPEHAEQAVTYITNKGEKDAQP